VSDETLDLREEAAGEPEPEVKAGDGGQDAAAAAGDPAGDAPAAAPKDLRLLEEVLEALIFVHRGILPPKTVREVLGEEFTLEEIAAGFASLRRRHEEHGGALTLVEVAGGYQFGTRPDLAPWIKKLDFYEHHRHLSRPTMETLAIIAYKQPVTRAEIEAIRGVNVERIVRNLLERKLVRILGHKDVPGKPMVLGTTREFLELFGLNSLADLPALKDFVEPPSAEGIDEEPPPALPGGAFGQGGDGEGSTDETAAPQDGAAEQENEHGREPGSGEGEPDAPEAPHDGISPADDADQAR
jgi:segregation and condensation protein B